MFFKTLNISFHGCVLLYKLWLCCECDLPKVFSLVFENSENLSNIAVISSLAKAKTNRCTQTVHLKFLAREIVHNLTILKAIVLFWTRGLPRFGDFLLLFFLPNKLLCMCLLLSSWSELLKGLRCTKGMNGESISYGVHSPLRAATCCRLTWKWTENFSVSPKTVTPSRRCCKELCVETCGEA